MFLSVPFILKMDWQSSARGSPRPPTVPDSPTPDPRLSLLLPEPPIEGSL